MALVHCQRGQHGPHVAAEVRVQESLLLGVELGGRQNDHARLCRQLGRDVFQEVAVQGRHHVMGAGADCRELLFGQHSVRTAVGHTAGQQLLQARDPHHEKLVQVGRHDALELAAFGQRDGGVARLLQNAPIELQPGQLAIDEVVRPNLRLGTDGRLAGRGRRALGRQGNHFCSALGSPSVTFL